jgi:hypothetical protein
VPKPVRSSTLLLFALALSAAGTSRAQPAASSKPEYSDYEQDMIEEAMRSLEGEPDPSPEGKVIESVEVVPIDVFDERDPVPDFFNKFHVTSRKYVLKRELLFDVGEPYRQGRIDESARNLRDLRQLSLVLIVPMRGSSPDRVRVLLITKDVWSLRLNSDFELSGGLIYSSYFGVVLTPSSLRGTELTYLLLNPSEENLFGTHASVGGLFILEPDTYSTGLLFRHPRVAGSRIETRVSGNIVFNRETGDPEGSFGHFYYGQPLYSIETEWAWASAVAWNTGVTRRFIGLTPRFYDGRPRAVRLVQPVCPPSDDRCIPWVYDSDRQLASYDVTRSWGRANKQDFSFGLEADRRAYRTPDFSDRDPAAVAAFQRNQVPVSDTRLSPFIQLRSYESRWVQLLDFNTLGLQEDLRLGHEMILRAYPASERLGSTRNMIGTFAALSYTVPLGTGLGRVIGTSVIEYELDGRHDAFAELDLRLVTPRFAFGRFVYDGVVFNRYQNYLNRDVFVGGDGRLRGYPLEAFFGKDLVASNVEFRSRSIEILSAHVGAAVFYDSADAFDGFDNLELKHSVGFGARVMFPQAARYVVRADWGFPLNPGYNTFPGAIIVTFQQAFGMPQLTPPSIVSTFVESAR